MIILKQCNDYVFSGEIENSHLGITLSNFEIFLDKNAHHETAKEELLKNGRAWHKVCRFMHYGA